MSARQFRSARAAVTAADSQGRRALRGRRAGGPMDFATGHNGLFDSRPVRHPMSCAGASALGHVEVEARSGPNLSQSRRRHAAGGGSLENAVRLDQHYTSGRAVEAYHDARRAMMKDHIAPSTSTLVGGFLRPRQEIEVHMIGVAPQGEFRPRHIRPKEQEVHPSSGYSLALEVGDYVFVAGRMADGSVRGGSREGSAPAGRASVERPSDSSGGGIHHSREDRAGAESRRFLARRPRKVPGPHAGCRGFRLVQ